MLTYSLNQVPVTFPASLLCNDYLFQWYVNYVNDLYFLCNKDTNYWNTMQEKQHLFYYYFICYKTYIQHVQSVLVTLYQHCKDSTLSNNTQANH